MLKKVKNTVPDRTHCFQLFMHTDSMQNDCQHFAKLKRTGCTVHWSSLVNHSEIQYRQRRLAAALQGLFSTPSTWELLSGDARDFLQANLVCFTEQWPFHLISESLWKWFSAGKYRTRSWLEKIERARLTYTDPCSAQYKAILFVIF